MALTTFCDNFLDNGKLLMPSFIKPYVSKFCVAITLLASLAILAGGCGVFSDYARDNQLHIGSLGLQDFISPVKLKVAILPFRDEVGLGTPEAGPNLAVLMTERFAENDQLSLVDPSEVARVFSAAGFDPTIELSAEQAIELGRLLNVNVVMDGAISQLDQRRLRVGWRRLIRIITNQQTYLDAVLTLVAYDTATGMVISARAGQGVLNVGDTDTPVFASPNDRTLPAPSQQAIEEGLDLAIDDAYYRTLDGLAYTPFKARVVDRQGQMVTIDYGHDVDLEKGLDFVALIHTQTIVNKIDVAYQIPGGTKARLVVRDVSDRKTTLEILDGDLEVGDFIQTWED
jgi:hypothetical protein